MTIENAVNETVDHDDLWEATYTPEDREGIKKIAADALLPSGSYIKVGGGTVTKGEDQFHPGRPQANVMIRLAPCKPENKNEPEENPDGTPHMVGVQFIRVSPVRVNWTTEDGVDTGQPDTSSKLYQQAYNAFRKAAQRDPEGPGEVLDYLENQSYRVRVIQKNTKEGSKGEPSNAVVAISALVSE